MRSQPFGAQSIHGVLSTPKLMILQLLLKEEKYLRAHKNTACTVCIVKFRRESPVKRLLRRVRNVLLYVLFLFFKD